MFVAGSDHVSSGSLLGLTKISGLLSSIMMKLLHWEIVLWKGGHSSFRLELMEVGSGSEFLEVHGPYGLF